MQRMQAGQAGELMVEHRRRPARRRAARLLLGDWTDRIAKGELPHAKPQRPQGVERNVVVTTWDWSDEKHYLHDLIVTDKRNPTVNGDGPLFGSARIQHGLRSRSSIRRPTPPRRITAPIRDPDMHEMLGPGHAAMEKPLGPSRLLGRGEDLDSALQQPQRDARPEGPGLDGGRVPRPEEPAELLQEGLGPSVGQAVPARRERAHAHGATIRRPRSPSSSTPASPPIT